MSSALVIASIATSVIGAGMGAMGAAQQGKQAQQLANFNAQVAQNNAIAARQTRRGGIYRRLIARHAICL